MRVVVSDSEPDRDEYSDEFTNGANATERSPSYLGTDVKSGIGNASNNCVHDNLSNVSSESDDDTSGAIFNNRDPNHRTSAIQSENDTPNPIERSNTVKRRADDGGMDLKNIISPWPRAYDKSSSSQKDRRPGKRVRLTRGQGPVSYDMKHHPMDDVLRPKYSAKRRANRRQVPEESSDSDEEIDEEHTIDTPSGKVISSNAHRRWSSRNIHKNKAPIYSAKWHPLDQMLRDNASSRIVSKKGGHSEKNRKNTSDSSFTLKDEESPTAINSDLDPDHDATYNASELGKETVPTSPDRRRSTRVSSKDAPPNYDMKYGNPIRRAVHTKANYFLQIPCNGFYPPSKGCCKANEVQATLSVDTVHLKQTLQQVGTLCKDSHQKASKILTKVLAKAFNTP